MHINAYYSCHKFQLAAFFRISQYPRLTSGSSQPTAMGPSMVSAANLS